MERDGDYSYFLEGADKDKWQEWLHFADVLEKKYNLLTLGEMRGDKLYMDYGYDENGKVYWEFKWDMPTNAKLEADAFFRSKFKNEE